MRVLLPLLVIRGKRSGSTFTILLPRCHRLLHSRSRVEADEPIRLDIDTFCSLQHVLTVLRRKGSAGDRFPGV